MIRRLVLLTIISGLMFALTGCGGGGGGSSAPPSQSPSISSQPTSLTVASGNNASFSVIANGTDLTYQWQVSSGAGFSNISDSVVYSGTSSKTLTIINSPIILNGSSYRVIVSGSVNPPVTSSSATLTVVSPTTAILKLNILGIPSGTLIGGIQVTFTLPSGVSLATNPATGEIASGVVTISGVANGSFGAQSYDPNTRLVSVAIINATGFGNGEYMTITASIASGSTVTTSSFPAQATAVSVIDTLGNSLSGFTLPINVTLQ